MTDALRYLKKILKEILNLVFPLSYDEEIARQISHEELKKRLAVRAAPEATALFPYRDDVIRALLWQLKYKNDTRSAQLFGKMLAEMYLQTLSGKYALAPIPLSKQRIRERGYNQVSRVAHIAVQTVPHITIAEDLLIRTKDTPRQTDLPRAQRLENLGGAFAVPDSKKVIGERIILLDDIITTGATLGEAKKTLLEAGAEEVRCVALGY